LVQLRLVIARIDLYKHIALGLVALGEFPLSPSLFVAARNPS
jgi:hypothetical protein